MDNGANAGPGLRGSASTEEPRSEWVAPINHELTRLDWSKLKNVLIRKASSVDIQSLWEVLASAFDRPIPLDSIQFYVNCADSTVYLSEVDGRIVGTGIATNYAGTSGWLGLISVRPEYQHRGIGKSLTIWGMEKLQAMGILTLTLTATPEGRPLYEKLGFRPERNHVVHVGSRRQHLTSNPSVRRQLPQDWEPVEALDYSATGERRASLLHDLQPGHVVVRKDGAIAGYHMSVPWDVGRGPSIAEDPETGRLLIDTAREAPSGEIVVAVPEENTAALDYLDDSGFTETSRATRMVYGPGPKHYRPERIWGVCSLAVG